MGNYKPGSDLDLTIRGSLDLTTLLKIENQLDDLLLPYKFDLSLLRALDNPELVENIQRVGVVFYERPSRIPTS